jgi:hypothetical protein
VREGFALAHFFAAAACASGRLLVVQMGVVLPGCPAESLLA